MSMNRDTVTTAVLLGLGMYYWQRTRFTSAERPTAQHGVEVEQHEHTGEQPIHDIGPKMTGEDAIVAELRDMLLASVTSENFPMDESLLSQKKPLALQ